jgi:hypothetical protein
MKNVLCMWIAAMSFAPSLLAAGTAEVKVTFRGLIAHILGDSIGRPSRAIVINDPDHPLKLTLPREVNLKDLHDATNLTVTLPPSGDVEVALPPGFSVRIVGFDTGKQVTVSGMSPFLNRDAKFIEFVPSLKSMSGNTLDFKKLNDADFDPYPISPDFAMFFVLDGGTLSAKPSLCKSRFKRDYEGKGDRCFASLVELTGRVDQEPALQFLKEGYKDWRNVTFNGHPSRIEVVVDARPKREAEGVSHFRMFEPLGKCCWKGDEIAYVKCDSKAAPECEVPVGDVHITGLDPSCTNSTWP